MAFVSSVLELPMVHVSRASLLLAVSAVLSLAACEAVDLGDAAAAEQGLIADATDVAAADIVDVDDNRPPRHHRPPGACKLPLAPGVEAHPRGAERGPPPAHLRHGHRGDHGPMLAIYDDNDDGALDDAERAALRADTDAGCAVRNAEVLAGFDVDGDHVLNAEEFAAVRASHDEEHRARHAARASGRPPEDDAVTMATWDLDDDGVLSASERRAVRQTLKTVVREGLRLPRLPAQLATGR